jgi:hypothetical protein
MRNINFKQILVLVLIFFFLFGDFFKVKKKIKQFLKYLSNVIFGDNRKKRT